MNEIDKVKERFNQASEVYSNQAMIRAGINLIPVVGGCIDVLLATGGQKYLIGRIETLIKELSEQMSLLDSSKINKDFLDTEEGFDLVIKAFNSAARTRQQEKLKLFAGIIKNTLIEGKEFHKEAPELYLRIVDELDVRELRVAKYLYTNCLCVHDKSMKYTAKDLSNTFTEFTSADLSYILMRLAKAGLLNEITITTMGSGFNAYIVNQLCYEFMGFIGELE